MRANSKLFFFGVAYLVGGLGVFSYSMMHWPDSVTIVLALLWFATFAAAQFLLFRCSRCRWPLLLAKRGRAIVPIGWIPSQCYRCHANTQTRTEG
jgi:hypothetical protein